MRMVALRQTLQEWSEDKCPRLAAALAFYTVFALAPLVLVVVAIVSLVYGEATARQSIVAQVTALVGEAGGRIVDEVLRNAPRYQTGIAGAVGIGLALAGATGVVGQLQDAMNTIWAVRARKTGWLRRLLLKRLLSLGFVVGLGFLLIVSLVLSAAIAGFGARLGGDLGPVALEAVHLAITLALFTALLACAYKVLPDVQVHWRDVWLGALVTAVMLALGKLALGVYLGRGTVGSAFGAAGSVVVLLAWIYYSGLIFMLGAEYTQVHADRAGRPIVPSRGAVPMVREHRIDRPDPGTKTGVGTGMTSLYVAAAGTAVMLAWMVRKLRRARD